MRIECLGGDFFRAVHKTESLPRAYDNANDRGKLNFNSRKTVLIHALVTRKCNVNSCATHVSSIGAIIEIFNPNRIITCARSSENTRCPLIIAVAARQKSQRARYANSHRAFNTILRMCPRVANESLRFLTRKTIDARLSDTAKLFAGSFGQ